MSCNTNSAERKYVNGRRTLRPPTHPILSENIETINIAEQRFHSLEKCLNTYKDLLTGNLIPEELFHPH